MGMSEQQLRALQSSDPTQVLGALGISAGGGTAVSEYDAADQEFAGYFAGPSGINAAEARAQQRGPSYITSQTGKVKYANGVIYDPSSQRVLYPPTLNRQTEMAGSDAWLRDVQEAWGDDKANEWRKKLWDQGYEGLLASDKGGWGADLVDALREYHARRYMNFGKVQPLKPTEKGGSVGQAVRESFDLEALRDRVKGWGDVPFGDSLTDQEADYFADRHIELAIELAKEHPNWSLNQVQTGAETRAMKEFTEDPQVKGLIQEQEDQEVSYKIRNNIVGLNQLLGA